MIIIIIHIVKEGDSLYSIGKMYNTDYKEIANYNKIAIDEDLVVGQTIVILTKNINKLRKIEVNGYAFPNIDINVLETALPSLTYLSIFSYSSNADGSLNVIEDDDLIQKAREYKVEPVMVVTNIGLDGHFDSDLAHTILNDESIQNKLIINILKIMFKKQYGRLNIDFEYVYPNDKESYIKFLNKINTEIKKYKFHLVVSVAPKKSDDQKGLLYEAHDYKRIGIIADYIVIMTYEWGYSGGPARAVAPINMVEEVLNYATTRIPSNKILMGIPNYGYDWTLPYKEGNIAESIGNDEAVDIARGNHQSINYNYEEQSPYFNYYDSSEKQHEVWFEDARSIQAKLILPMNYNLRGVSYWTITRSFPQNYLILNSLYSIRKYN